MTIAAAHKCIKPQCHPAKCTDCNCAIAPNDEAGQLVLDLLNTFAVDGMDLPFEDGDSQIVDRARKWLQNRPTPAPCLHQIAEPAPRAALAAVPEGWHEQFAAAVYEDLAAADNQDVPLEEYPARILKVMDSIVGPRHPTVVKWRNDAIRNCIAIARKYCRDPESHKYLQQDLEAMLATDTAPAHPAEGVPAPVAVGEREALELAKQFHEAYERLAPQFGYETREDTRQFDAESQNGKLMIAVCAEVQSHAFLAATPAAPAPSDEAITAWAMEEQADAIKALRASGFVRVARAVLARWAAGVPAAAHDARQWLQEADMAALERFAETTEDDQSYDIGKDAVKRLAHFGCVESTGFGRYSITAFGSYVLGDWVRARDLPFMTQADRDAEHRAARAAQQGGAA